MTYKEAIDAARRALGLDDDERHARHNLLGVLHDLKESASATTTAGAACVRTVERVCDQLADAEEALEAAESDTESRLKLY